MHNRCNRPECRQGHARIETATSQPKRDKPWIFRTYAGHSTAAESNALYRENLAKGQTGLSVAFDLPTQTGYDSDHVLAQAARSARSACRSAHLGDMRALFDGIPLGTMNTSMTINATAAWLLALYIAVADEQGAPRAALQGTIQNDIIKEYLSRGTYVFPPAPSMRLIKDVDPVHDARDAEMESDERLLLPPAGGRRDAGAGAGLRARDRHRRARHGEGIGRGRRTEKFGEVVGRISFFVNAGMRFITEICKMRAFAELWDEITRERYGITDPKQRLFRYGVQVNSLGLTEPQPENNVYAHPARDAGGDAVEERARPRRAAAGLERGARPAAAVGPAMVAAHAADPRLRDRPARIRRHLRRLDGDRRARSRSSSARRSDELARIDEMGGAVAAVESGYMKQPLVESNTARLEAIERGEQIVVGVNKFIESEPSPLAGGDELDHDRVGRRRARGRSSGSRPGAPRATTRPSRRRSPSSSAPPRERRATSCRPRSPAPKPASPPANGAGRCARRSANTARRPASATRCATTSTGSTTSAPMSTACRSKLGRRLTFLVGKPGLDGHSNGAEQIAVRARDAGMEVVYRGHPPDAGRDRRRRARAEGPRDRPVGAVGQPLPLVEDVVAPHARGRPRQCRSWSAASSRPRTPHELEAIRRRRGLHAEGFRAEPHHVGRGADRRARERRRSLEAELSAIIAGVRDIQLSLHWVSVTGTR